MKKYIIEKRMINNTDGYYAVVVEGETHINRTIIESNIQFFTTQSGYDYNHPHNVAKQNAQAIANGLNDLEKEKENQRKRIIQPINEYSEKFYL
ncbi:MAG: hypothetical protein M0R03_20745 [Novosphingobium sp.]|nr:hypothetical protein [Novosphingobium sp.]